MNEFKKTLLKLFLDHPLDFNIYLDGYKNKDYAYRVIKSFIPTDTGIEWEIGHDMVQKLIHRPKAPWRPILSYESSFEVTYRIHIEELNRQLNQLQQMYAFMDKPRHANIRQAKSGIHIHTNIMTPNVKDIMNKLISDPEIVTRKAVRYIANNFFHYGGTYNDLKFDWSKGNAIIYRREYNTIEYRCINMTWDFRELLKYIVTCHYMTNLFLQYGKDRITGIEFLERMKAFIQCILKL